MVELCKFLEAQHRNVEFVSMVTATHYEVATKAEYCLSSKDWTVLVGCPQLGSILYILVLAILKIFLHYVTFYFDSGISARIPLTVH